VALLAESYLYSVLPYFGCARRACGRFVALQLLFQDLADLFQEIASSAPPDDELGLNAPPQLLLDTGGASLRWVTVSTQLISPLPVFTQSPCMQPAGRGQASLLRLAKDLDHPGEILGLVKLDTGERIVHFVLLW
jgi:hypothetical protein